MLFKYINFFQNKILILLVFLSFALFWWRAVGGDINVVNICRLIVGSAIILPIFFVTENLRVQLKKIFGGEYKYLKLCLYIISISAFYSILIMNLYPAFFSITAFFNCSIILIWQPFFILILKYFFIDRLKNSEQSKVFFFILIVLAYKEVYFFSDYRFYDFTLLQIHIANFSKFFNLLTLWGTQLPIILILLSDISSDYFGFHKKWSTKAIVATLFVLGILILNFKMAIYIQNFHIGSKQYVTWNMLTFCYDAIIISFSEEFFFRGIIQNYISRKLAIIKDGNIFAIIITATIFALYHFPFTETTAFSSVFIFGIILGWLYDKTKSIWPPIFIHGIQNLVFSSSAILS